MSSLPVVSDPKTRQAEFQVGYIWVALATAIIAGFAIGAHLSFVIGFDFPVGKGFYSFIQTHGHVQVVGWAGLFIIGITLHLIPRLASVPLSHPHWIPRILWLMAAGLLLRSAGHPVVPYLAGGGFFVSVNWLTAGSGLLEWCGIVMYVWLLLRTLHGRTDIWMQPALLAVRPYFGMMLTGWFLYGSLNLILLVTMAVRKNIVMDQGWNEFAVRVFIGLVLLPIAFAFSVRMLPLYLTLRAPDWPVRGTGYAYLLSVGLQLVATIPPLSEMAPGVTGVVSNLGMLLKGGVILWFVWQFDILTRRWEPWTVKRDVQPSADRRLTRGGLSDYGEFGRFERLIYAAYTWLVLAACFEVIDGGAALLGLPLPVGTDPVRHMYLLGFITHLIFGVSVRLIPGLLKKKCVASTALVEATLWLGSTAVVCRALPWFIRSGAFEGVPGVLVAAQAAFAFSGIIGLGAVLCLGVNLWKTAAG